MSGRDEPDAPDAGFGEASRYAAHIDRGWALLDKGELSAARTSVAHAQDVRPDEPDASLLLGAIALGEGNAAEALRCYDRAIELDPEYLEPYAAAAAVCLYDLDDPARALRYIGDALELEELAPLEALDLQLLAAECELAGDDVHAAGDRLRELPTAAVLEATLALTAGGLPSDPAELVADDPVRDAAWQYLALDAEGEALEDEERVERGQRALGLALRLCQLRADAELLPEAHALVVKLAQWFPRDAEVWGLRGELEFRAGAVVEAARAGLRTLELDAEAPLPEFVPSPAVVHRKVLQALANCGELRLSSLVERTAAPAILVRELPPAELVLEGVSPRVAVIATASRPDGPDPRGTDRSELTGLTVYRKNIARMVRDLEGFEDELRYCVLEELAAFFALPARVRKNLGLDPIEAPPLRSPPDRADESLVDAKPPRRKGPRKRKE
ncbi:MAG: tetratricopeptide repeat protein [Nannocystaceae bacterium]|nr:tetratricopeptide repeat protein [Nannocystaceae bacterium]